MPSRRLPTGGRRPLRPWAVKARAAIETGRLPPSASPIAESANEGSGVRSPATGTDRRWWATGVVAASSKPPVMDARTDRTWCQQPTGSGLRDTLLHALAGRGPPCPRSTATLDSSALIEGACQRRWRDFRPQRELPAPQCRGQPGDRPLDTLAALATRGERNPRENGANPIGGQSPIPPDRSAMEAEARRRQCPGRTSARLAAARSSNR